MEAKAGALPQRLGKLLDGIFVRQLLVYGLSVGGTMVVAFALVLILVRVLPAEAYGGLVLTKVLLLVVISLGGLGLSQAAVRWVGFRERPELVLGTILGGVALAALPAAAVLIGLMAAFAGRLTLSIEPLLVAATCSLVLSYMFNNELLNWSRALHQARRHAVLNTVRALEQLSFVTAGVLLAGNVAGFVYGLAVGELLFMGWLAIGHRGRLAFRFDLLRKMLRYSWPHTFVIASSFLLIYVDRYMLAFLTNDTSVVAHYDAAYILVSSALALVVRPFNLFLFPAYTKRYAEEGRDATVRMVEKAQHFFLIAGLGVATLVVLLREPMLGWLYPAGYQSAASIFAAVAYGTLLNGVFMATVAGLYISDRTLMVGVVVMVALTVNILANWLLIPLWGVDGAAISTALAGLVQVAVGHYYARKILPVKLPIIWLGIGAAWLGLVQWVSA